MTEKSATGSTFGGWSGGGCSGAGTTCTVTMSSAQTVTARFDAGSAPPPPAPHCTIHANSDKVATKKSKKKGAVKPGVLTVTVKCNQSAGVSVRGKVTIQGKKRKHGKGVIRTVSCGPFRGSATANVSLTLTVKLPGSAVSGLKSGDKESVALSLTATNANGSATATATIPRLHAA